MPKAFYRFGFLLLAALSLAPALPPGKTSVAIYPIKAAGATDKSVASALSALLSSELTPSTKLYVIEEAMLKTVMDRQGLNASDACDDTSCQVEIGKLVKAQKMITGDVVKLGSLYILSLKLVDIQTGAIEFSTKDQCACTDEQLPNLVAVAAAKIRNHYGEAVSVPGLPAASLDKSPPAGTPANMAPIATAVSAAIPVSAWVPGSYSIQESHRPGTKGGPMVFVPAGEFWMGCNDRVDNECQNDEKPYHKVYLDAYYIDKSEVTQGEYSDCVKTGQCKDNPKYDGFAGTRQPVEGVDWNDAKSYCEWAGKHLPTEAQWEKAARGTDGRKYPWGNQMINCSMANYSDCNKEKTVEVGAYASGASPYGALDMMGNAWEWVADWYDKGYYSSSPERNPTGPSSGTSRVLRGGSWYDRGWYLRTSIRYNYGVPTLRGINIGFRCVGN